MLLFVEREHRSNKITGNYRRGRLYPEGIEVASLCMMQRLTHTASLNKLEELDRPERLIVFVLTVRSSIQNTFTAMLTELPVRTPLSKMLRLKFLTVNTN
jgi:hypothetical protein